MTSDENNDETINFFEKNNYFGYNKEKVVFFKQGRLPMMHTNGKILMNSKSSIKEAADGNGGIFEALFKNNIIEEMKKNNIEWLGIGNVDNILLNLADPIYIGMTIEKGVQLSTKTVKKASPEEKVGVVCKINDKPGVVEYTEISKEMSEQTDENGELVYGQSYFGCALYNISLLDQIGTNKLPYHIAVKKSNFINENGQEEQPDTPNAYKFEAFIFDSFKFTNDILLLNVKREEEFAPIKNATGADSPETARELYLNYMNKQ